MKCKVVYFSQTGNTKSLAEAIYSGIRSAGDQCDLSSIWDVDPASLAEFELIGLGCPVHRMGAAPPFLAFERSLPILDGKHAFLFASHGPVPGAVFREMGEVLLDKRITLIGYRGWYATDWAPGAPKPYYTDGHPDSLDLQEAADFGRRMVESSLRVSQGETDAIPDILSIPRDTLPPESPTELRLNRERCRYPICRVCVENCPVERCIDPSPQAAAFVDLEKCVQCYFCYLTCPSGAIEADFRGSARTFKDLAPIQIRLLDKAKARGEFRSLVDRVDFDTPWEASRETPQFAMKVAPCTLSCPLHIDIPGYLSLAAVGQMERSQELLRAVNPLAGVCGRVCYHPCEDVCSRSHVDEAVSIASLERLVADRMKVEDVNVSPQVRNGVEVAVIGSGPAGLSAARDLAILGYEVTIFEANSEPGGMLRMGIPEYRLPREVLDREISYIESLGVRIETNTAISASAQFEGLRHRHSALFVATGAQESLLLSIPGGDSPGVLSGLTFLRLVNSGAGVDIGHRVAIVGGGNAALDAARVARRLGASVTLAYHRSRAEMPASVTEVEAAEQEGVEFTFLAAPVEVVSEHGKRPSVRFVKTTLGTSDESGRSRPVPVEGSEFTIEADSLITALGQKPDSGFVEGTAVRTLPDGRLLVDEITLATDVDGVFAGGDVVTGPATVVDAVAAGKRAARSIDNYLKGIPMAVGQTDGRKSSRALTEGEAQALRSRVPVQRRVQINRLVPEERISGFSEVEAGLDPAEGQREGERCMGCDWKPGKREGCARGAG